MWELLTGEVPGTGCLGLVVAAAVIKQHVCCSVCSMSHGENNWLFA